jgi:hypothetical protein
MLEPKPLESNKSGGQMYRCVTMPKATNLISTLVM